MAWSLLAHTSAHGSSGCTTAAINCTGADLIVVVGSQYAGVSNSSVSDSKSNIWSHGTAYSYGYELVQIWYVQAPTVDSAQTFTWSNGGSNYGGCVVLAYSGSASSPFDKENGNAGAESAHSIQPGSITPSTDGQLLISGISMSDNLSPSINLSFTIEDSEFGDRYGAGADLIQATAAAINPTWSWSGGTNAVAVAIASFKPAAGGGGTSVALSGQQSASQEGSPGLTVQTALSGQQTAAAQGTLTPVTGVSVALTGQESAAQQGSPGLTTSTALTGQQSAAAQGTVGALASQALTGQQTAAGEGSYGVSVNALLSGQQTASEEGTITATGGNVFVALTGQSVQAFQGIFIPVGPPVPTTGIPGGKGDSFDNEETMRYFAQQALEAKFAKRDEQDVEDAMRVMMQFLTERRP